MPSVQAIKKRLSHGVLVAISYASMISKLKLIEEIDPCFFAYCILRSNKLRFLEHFDEENIDGSMEFLLENCISKSRKKTLSVDQVRVDPYVIECLMMSKSDPDKIGAPQIFYKLIKKDRVLSSVVNKFCITPNSILDMVNKESKKAEIIQKSKKGIQQNTKTKKNDLIEKFCIDLSQRAEDGLLDPVFCRENEMDQLLIALMKKTKANPLLIGEPGVGKTAIVEGIAQRLANGDVPKRLIGYRIVSLSMASALQGTSLRGQFEERIDNLLKELVEEKKVIVFIDEIHTMIGAGGGSEGALDAGNIMKPYLARGEIRCIGATTFDDYHKFLKKDRALLRRFQRIFVSEPGESESRRIIEGLAPGLETHHGCVIGDGVFDSVINLTRRFVSDRCFPDKAIDCLDHSCAKSSLVSGIVTPEIVEEVVSDFSDVPISIVRKGDVERLEDFDIQICKEILGNDKAVSEFCNRIRFCCATKESRVGPMASMTLFGPKGVGKKSIVSMLSRRLCGKDSLVVINGAEFSEGHSVSRIIGSPPGYVGYNEETYLLREVRRRPHSVIMVKNIELMNSSVAEQIGNIIEDGRITDVHGMIADFSNCIIAFVVDIEKIGGGPMGFAASSGPVSYFPMFKKIREKNPILHRIKYQIEFKDIDQSVVSNLVDLEVERFRSDLEGGGIIIELSDECKNKIVLDSDGSPSEIRSEARDKLELALCQGLSLNRSAYRFMVKNNEITVESSR